MTKHLLAVTTSIAAIAAFVPVAVYAQTAAAAPQETTDTDQNDGIITEVIVTSQRRSEKLQNVAIAETALTGTQLREKAVNRIADLQMATPAMSITENGLVSAVNIRGIGLSSGSPQVTNGVASYVNGLFQPPIVQSNSFYDVANVEVLRGPQGTLVGSNSTGGAILVTTQNPTLLGVEGYAQINAGDYSAYGFEGAVNVPVGDHFAFRLAGMANNRDTYYTDHGPFDSDAGSLDEDAARLSLLLKNNTLQLLYKVEYAERSTGGVAYQPIPGTPFSVAAYPGPFNLDYNSPTSAKENAWIHGLEIRYEMANGITFRSLTGYQDKKFRGLWDNDATRAIDNATDQFVRERQASQEINIISPMTGAFNWIVGAYYQHNQIDVRILQTQTGTLPVNVLPTTDKLTTGVFAQLGYKVNDQVEVQFGVRESGFRSSGEGGVYIGRGVPGFPADGLLVGDTAGRYSDHMPTGKLSLNYKPDINNLLYAFVARGYKAGGFNSSTSTFEPETVWNYEVGWKSTFYGGRLRTQFDIFANSYNNFQLDILDTTTGSVGIRNLPSATVNGVEGQFQSRFGGFTVDGSFAYVDSQLGAITAVDIRPLPGTNLGPQCPTGTPSTPPVCFDYTPYTFVGRGGPNLLSPEWTYNLSVGYRFELGHDLSLTPRLNMSHQDATYSYVTYASNAYVPARTLYSALVTFQTPKWTLELYGNNIGNEVYVVGQSTQNQFFGAPREIGVRLRRDF